uniref:Uncharacterized protein n=1 Tax=viral metagenome TaxID=1070528 RepID=A0A6C0KQ45_9ZZZZ
MTNEADLRACENRLRQNFLERILNATMDKDDHAFHRDLVKRATREHKLDNAYYSYIDPQTRQNKEMLLVQRNQQTLLPLDMTQLWFRFTGPVIAFDTDYNLLQIYKLIREGDSLFIFGTLDARGKVKHITAVIETDETILSFGLGAAGATEDSYKDLFGEQKSLLITPDSVFEYKFLKQLQNPKERHVKLIASTTLTKEHVLALNHEFDQITLENLYSKVYSSYSTYTPFTGKTVETYKNNMVKFLQSGAYSYSEDQKIRTMYSDTSKNLKVSLFPVLCFSYIADLATTKYCTLSSFSKREKSNCASFVQRMFKSVINCSVFQSKYLRTDRIVSNPDYCRQCFKKSPLRKCKADT